MAAVVEMLDLITATNQESIASGIPRAEAKIPYEVSSGILAYHFSDVCPYPLTCRYVRMR